jgi:hypothetical protein
MQTLDRAVALVVAAAACGCAVAPLPRSHFTLDATNEEYPVMLSRTATPDRGRNVDGNGLDLHEWAATRTHL